MKTVELDVAQLTLGDLIAELGSGDEVVIVQNKMPIAKLSPVSGSAAPRLPGLFKDVLTIEAEDDAHLTDFEEYLQ